jgi:hypothetical protein
MLSIDYSTPTPTHQLRSAATLYFHIEFKRHFSVKRHTAKKKYSIQSQNSSTFAGGQFWIVCSCKHFGFDRVPVIEIYKFFFLFYKRLRDIAANASQMWKLPIVSLQGTTIVNRSGNDKELGKEKHKHGTDQYKKEAISVSHVCATSCMVLQANLGCCWMLKMNSPRLLKCTRSGASADASGTVPFLGKENYP